MGNAVIWVAAIACIIVCAACGIMCSNLAEYKGYSTGAAFWCGLLLGVFALIYYAGLPVSDEKRKECNNSDNMELASRIIDLINGERGKTGTETEVKPIKPKTQAAVVGTARRIPDGEDVRGIQQCKCSECGTRQCSDRSVCWHCGRTFEN